MVFGWVSGGLVGFVWDRVDGVARPEELVEVQEGLESWAVVRAYRGVMRELTGTAGVLDLGSGPGGETTFVGVDNSMAMARRATARGRRIVVGDAVALPFTDGAFTAFRADRVFQHLADPVRALAEAVRVVETGGRVVVADPDQSTLTIHAGGCPLAEAVTEFRRTHVRNPDFAGRAAEVFEAAGLTEVQVWRRRLVLTEPGRAFGITTWGELMVEEGLFDRRQWQDWESALAGGEFRYGLDYVVTAGHRAA
jgi:SAM-dependent methyltransferase